ncbi:PAS domain-containing protein [Methylobacterium terricola]|uniref:histidine kinase n=1 Tax=Methylobacterium terricola TaxID=2583531 RepID=A0A5C4L838_9HYPH|nr:PAS domain-containing protein [Methylobacterium terricola]TNC07659.1 PAS domain-containing protein [Methylobacterium terricola]
MIFVTDATGQCVYVSSEWTSLTGQPVNEALAWGWLDRVHPEDRQTVSETICAAVKTAAEFCVRYRLLRADDSPRWIGAGGVPSFGMEEGCFIGYLGSITELAEGATDTIAAYGNVGRFVPPEPHPSTMPGDHLDLIADHLILAHSMIEGDGARAALPHVKLALLEIGIALAARTREAVRPLN